jgi:hypothetical protein
LLPLCDRADTLLTRAPLDQTNNKYLENQGYGPH